MERLLTCVRCCVFLHMGTASGNPGTEVYPLLYLRVYLRIPACMPPLSALKTCGPHMRLVPQMLIDIGANAGIVSILLAKKYPMATVLAFEANPVIFQYLTINLRNNNVTNVVPHNCALTADAQPVQIRGRYSTSAIDVINPGLKKQLEAHPPRQDVDVDGHWVGSVRLKDVYEHYNISKVPLLKIDCEHCEYDVLPQSWHMPWARLAGELHIPEDPKGTQELVTQMMCNQTGWPLRYGVVGCQILQAHRPRRYRHR